LLRANVTARASAIRAAGFVGRSAGQFVAGIGAAGIAATETFVVVISGTNVEVSNVTFPGADLSVGGVGIAKSAFGGQVILVTVKAVDAYVTVADSVLGASTTSASIGGIGLCWMYGASQNASVLVGATVVAMRNVSAGGYSVSGIGAVAYSSRIQSEVLVALSRGSSVAVQSCTATGSNAVGGVGILLRSGTWTAASVNVTQP
jgi:hypothetical protein